MGGQNKYDEILQRVYETGMLDTVEKHKLVWLGHVLRHHY